MVFVAHPIQDRSDDEMRALADTALPAILARLLAEPPPGPPERGRPVAWC